MGSGSMGAGSRGSSGSTYGQSGSGSGASGAGSASAPADNQGLRTVSGAVAKVAQDSITLDRAAGGVTLTVDSQTQVIRNGKPSTGISSIREGEKVRASFDPASNRADKIEVMGKHKGGMHHKGMSDSAGGSTMHNSGASGSVGAGTTGTTGTTGTGTTGSGSTNPPDRK